MLQNGKNVLYYQFMLLQETTKGMSLKNSRNNFKHVYLLSPPTTSFEIQLEAI